MVSLDRALSEVPSEEPSEEPSQRHRWERLRRAISALGIAATVAIAALTVIGFVGRAGWLAEIAASFRVQYVIGVLMALVILAIGYRFIRSASIARAVVALALATVVANLAVIVPLYMPPSRKGIRIAESREHLRIVQFNSQSVEADGGRFDRFRAYIDGTNPDLIAIEDLTPEWSYRIEAELPQFAHSKELPIRSGGGIGLYSRIPIEDARLRYFTESEPGLPSITARIRLGGEPIDLIVTHPLAPTDPSGWRARNSQLDAIAAERERLGPDVIVVGDLNMTSWSDEFGRFSSAMGVADSRKGFGVQPTWPSLPTWSSLPTGAMIPIDHALASDRFVTFARQTGPGGISQHLPVFVDLGFTPRT